MIIAVTRKGRRISMAIKIIKPGKKPETVKRFTCRHCGCVFEADEGDYELVFNFCNGNYVLKVDCPDCGYTAIKSRDE